MWMSMKRADVAMDKPNHLSFKSLHQAWLIYSGQCVEDLYDSLKLLWGSCVHIFHRFIILPWVNVTIIISVLCCRLNVRLKQLICKHYYMYITGIHLYLTFLSESIHIYVNWSPLIYFYTVDGFISFIFPKWSQHFV